MAINGFVPCDNPNSTVAEIPIWRENIPTDNYWVSDGKHFLETLSMDDVIYILERNRLARQDYLDAVNPLHPEYAKLINVPLVENFDDSRSAKEMNNANGVKDSYLWKDCRGVCPYPW
jgi:hypothetical protein